LPCHAAEVFAYLVSWNGQVLVMSDESTISSTRKYLARLEFQALNGVIIRLSRRLYVYTFSAICLSTPSSMSVVIRISIS